MRSLRLTTFWIVCATLTLGAFNNCTQIQTAKGGNGTATEKSAGTGGGLNYNGSGYSGKMIFAYYGATPVCQSGTGSADSEIRLGDGQIELFTNSCSSTSVQILQPDQIFTNPYDPYYLVHDDNVYVNESITAGAGKGERKVVHSFCYNAEAQVDFAVRFESKFNNGWQVKTIGHAIQGRGKDEPQVLEVPGVLQENSDPDNKPFVAHDGSYRLDFLPKTSLTRGPAVLTLAGGNTLPVDCFYLKLPGPPDGAKTEGD